MAEITLDTSHALSRPDQHRNRQQLFVISTCGFRPLIVSPETGERSSRKNRRTTDFAARLRRNGRFVRQTHKRTPKGKLKSDFWFPSFESLAFFCVFVGQIFRCCGAALRNPW